jgi:glycosyltransferase involved in cell wall biosynthesis
LHLAVRRNSPLRDALQDLPVAWHELGLRNALDVISARQLASIIRGEKIEVIHAHLARDYIFCGLATRMAGPVKFFLTRHHFNSLKSSPFYAWAIGETRTLIAVSQSVREQLVTAFPAFADRIVVIPNWIDPRSERKLNGGAARRRLGLTRRLAVGVIGQLTRLKRQDLFIQAAAHLIKEREWTDVDFLIMGEPGPNDRDYVRQLHEIVRAAGIEDQVRFTGYIEDLPAHLPALDVVAVPSENEAFSLVLVEAMAAGRAVVAARVGGLAEIVEDGVSGIFSEPDDLWSLVAGLSKLLTDKALRERLGMAARTHVTERFNRERVIDRIEKLYLHGLAGTANP